jgi:hypothetical protein
MGVRCLATMGLDSWSYVVDLPIMTMLNGMIGPTNQELPMGLDSAEGHIGSLSAPLPEGHVSSPVKRASVEAIPPCLVVCTVVRGKSTGPRVTPPWLAVALACCLMRIVAFVVFPMIPLLTLE